MSDKPRNEKDAAGQDLGVVSGRSQESPRPLEYGTHRRLPEFDPAAIRRRKRYETVRRAKAFHTVLNRRWRKSGLTSKRLAELAKINHDVLRSWLSRGIANPSDATMPAIHRLCKVLGGMKPDELLHPLNDQNLRIEFRVAALLPRLSTRQLEKFENMLDALESDVASFDRLVNENANAFNAIESFATAAPKPRRRGKRSKPKHDDDPLA